MKKAAIKDTKCVDTLLEIGGRKFLGVPVERCTLLVGTSVEVIDGPIEVKDADGNFSTVIKVRHINELGAYHEGWVNLIDLQ